jgi:hypothetical protein
MFRGRSRLLPPRDPVDVTTLSCWQWMEAALDLEETGQRIDDRELARRLKIKREHASMMWHHLRKTRLLSESKVGARGRWVLQIPTLCYVVTSLDPMDPHGTAADAVTLATDLAVTVGPPLVTMMPTSVVLSKAATGDDNALDAMVGFAQRADVVLVIGGDPLLEDRFDVVAAQQANVLVVVTSPEGDPPYLALRNALMNDARDTPDFWRKNPISQPHSRRR